MGRGGNFLLPALEQDATAPRVRQAVDRRADVIGHRREEVLILGRVSQDGEKVLLRSRGKVGGNDRWDMFGRKRLDGIPTFPWPLTSDYASKWAWQT